MATIGNIRRVSAVFTVSGTDTDPTTVTVRVRTPGGVESSLIYGVDAAVVRTATGRYYLDLTGSEVGRYDVRFEGTGAATAADTNRITFTSSGFSS